MLQLDLEATATTPAVAAVESSATTPVVAPVALVQPPSAASSPYDTFPEDNVPALSQVVNTPWPRYKAGKTAKMSTDDAQKAMNQPEGKKKAKQLKEDAEKWVGKQTDGMFLLSSSLVLQQYNGPLSSLLRLFCRDNPPVCGL